jgi:hypothetical protein
VENEEMKQAVKSHYSYTKTYSYLRERLILQEIRQMRGLEFQRDLLMKYKKEGILGEVYFSDGRQSRYWYTDDMAANIIAYRIVRRDSLLNNLLVPMQQYFIATRENGGWNTYRLRIISNVLSDLFSCWITKIRFSKVNGKENKTITDFPYHLDLKRRA